MIRLSAPERTPVGLFSSFHVKSRDAGTRRRAAAALGAPGRTSAIPRLGPLLDDPEWEVRQAAIASLGRIGDPSAAPLLVAAVTGADRVSSPEGASAVRAAAGEALGQLGVAAVPVLVEALRGRHAKLRETAIAALGAIGGTEAVGALAGMVDDDRSSVRQAAIGALARAAGPEAVPALLRVLTHRDPTTRRCAIDALGALGRSVPVAPVKAALADPDRGVRDTAVRALGGIGTTESASALVAALEGGDRDLHAAAWAALRAFDWTPEGEAARVVHAVLRGRFDDATAQGAAAAGPLVTLLADRDPSLRRDALEALGRIGVPATAPAIGAALRDADPAVRQAAVVALTALGSAAADTVVDSLGDRTATARASAEQALAAIGAGEVAGALLARLSAGQPTRHGDIELRVVETRDALDRARRAADLLDALVRHAGAALPVDALRRIATAPDAMYLEPGRVPDGSDRTDLEALRDAAWTALERRGVSRA
jgi:HEAT repeat protein